MQPRKRATLPQKTFDITKQEQVLGAKSGLDTLNAESALAQAESALDTAQTAYEKAKVDIDRAIGETLERTGVSIDDAKVGRGDSCAVESLRGTRCPAIQEPR